MINRSPLEKAAAEARITQDYLTLRDITNAEIERRAVEHEPSVIDKPLAVFAKGASFMLGAAYAGMIVGSWAAREASERIGTYYEQR